MVKTFHGALLNHRHGKAVEGGLMIAVTHRASATDSVTINGTPAQRNGDVISAEVTLRDKKDKETDIVAGRGRREASSSTVSVERCSTI